MNYESIIKNIYNYYNYHHINQYYEPELSRFNSQNLLGLFVHFKSKESKESIDEFKKEHLTAIEEIFNYNNNILPDLFMSYHLKNIK